MLKTLTRMQKERALTFAQFTVAQTGFACVGIDRIKHDTVLTVCEGGGTNLTNAFLVHIWNVHFSLIHGHKPFITGFALFTKHIGKGASGTQMQCTLICQHDSRYFGHNAFVHTRHVCTRLTVKPFFARRPCNAVGVNCVALGAQLECKILLDYCRTHHCHFFNLNTWDVRLWSNKKPFISSNALLTLCFVGKVTQSAQKIRLVHFDVLEL
mmetsp:Transcript_4586/g.6879  ORF Transcript_4586/g.6879 Transcript_4586/m.6879 type:complete len:211 (-) Transcript_4586:365-997(-)